MKKEGRRRRRSGSSGRAFTHQAVQNACEVIHRDDKLLSFSESQLEQDNEQKIKYDGRELEHHIKVLKSGDRYEGFYNKSGRRHGYGVYLFANGDIYSGEWFEVINLYRFKNEMGFII